MAASATLEVLIEIQAQLAGLQATVSGMSGLDSAAADAATTLGSVSTQLDAIRGNLGGLDETRTKLEEVTGAGQEFFESIKAGFALDIAGRITGQIVGIGEAFKAAGERGVEYDAKMQTSTIGLAGALRSIEPGKFLNFDQAQVAAGLAMDVIRQRANAAGLDVHSVMEAESADLKAMVDGGITDTGKQLDVVTTLMGAAASKGIVGVQALRDSIDILNGRAGNIVLAKELGLESEALKQAAHNGQEYEYIMARIGGYREAMVAQASSFQGVSQTFHNLMEQMEGDAARPIFTVLQTGIAGLNKDLQANGGLATELRDVGRAAADVVGAGVGVTSWAVQNAGAIVGLGRVVLSLAAGYAILKTAELAIGSVGAVGNFINAKAAAYDAAEAAAATEKWAAAQVKEAEAANLAAAAEERLAIIRREADLNARLYGEHNAADRAGAAPQLYGPPVELAAPLVAAEAEAAPVMARIEASFAAMFASIGAGAATLGKAIYAALGPVGIAFIAAEGIYLLVDHACAAAEARESQLLDLMKKVKDETSDFKRQLATVDTAQERNGLVKSLDDKIKELTAARDDVAKQVAALDAARTTHGRYGAGQGQETDEQKGLQQTLNLRQGELDLVDRIRGKAQNLSSEELNRRSIEQAITTEVEAQSKALSEMIAKLPSIIVGLKDAAHQAELANNLANQADATGKLSVLNSERSRLISQATTAAVKAGAGADTMIGSAADVTDQVQAFSDRARGKGNAVSPEEAEAGQQLIDSQKELAGIEQQITNEQRGQTQQLKEQAETSAKSKADYDYRLGHAQLIAHGEQGAADQMERQHGIAEAATKLAKDNHATYESQVAAATKLYDAEVAANDAVKAGKDAKKEGAAADRESLNVVKEQAAYQREIEQDKLKSIQGFGSRVQENPFLDEESKAKLMMSVYAQERDQITQIMRLDQQRIALERQSTNPGMAAQLRNDTKGLASAAQELQKVNQQMRTLSFSGTMQKSLTAWVNQFGTTAQAAATIITTTLSHAVEGLSSAISGLVLGTMTWKQAFSQAASAVVQDIIRIVIQQTVGRAVMSAVNAAFGSEDASTSAALASASAAAWEEAAILASIASYGGAAAEGEAAVVLAVATGSAALSATSSASGAGGSFAVGGYTGDGLAHELAGAVHRGEYVMDASTVRRAGGPATFDRMRSQLNASETTRTTAGIGPGRGVGGRAGGTVGGPGGAQGHVHFATFNSQSEAEQYLKSAKGERHLVNLTRKRRHSIGIRT